LSKSFFVFLDFRFLQHKIETLVLTCLFLLHVTKIFHPVSQMELDHTGVLGGVPQRDRHREMTPVRSRFPTF
jgi:hypothetical protein